MELRLLGRGVGGKPRVSKPSGNTECIWDMEKKPCPLKAGHAGRALAGIVSLLRFRPGGTFKDIEVKREQKTQG